MAETLTKAIVAKLAPPASGQTILFDSRVKGFGVRMTAGNACSFIFNYRTRNGARQRRYTIGTFPDWSVEAARKEAAELRRRVDRGEDPMGEVHAERAAPTINDLADRFEAEHLPKRRPSTQVDYKSILKLYIRPTLGRLKVGELRHADIEELHRTVAAHAPYRANRTVAVISKMMGLAVKWEMRADNPSRGIERAPETKRERFLKPREIVALGEALAERRERTSADVIRLLALTGARCGEALGARWDQLDLEAGIWTKPATTTKQAREHRLPLGAAALALLGERKALAERTNDDSPYVFPGPGGKPLTDIKRTWLSLCRKAGLAEQVEKQGKYGKPVKDAKGAPVMVWRATARIHDLRHTYASILASAGISLPIIGALLGHTQAATTARYSHLMDDPLRAATERVGAVVTGQPSAEVVSIRGTN